MLRAGRAAVPGALRRACTPVPCGRVWGGQLHAVSGGGLDDDLPAVRVGQGIELGLVVLVPTSSGKDTPSPRVLVLDVPARRWSKIDIC